MLEWIMMSVFSIYMKFYLLTTAKLGFQVDSSTLTKHGGHGLCYV